VPFELIKPDTRIDFVGQAKYAIALSLAILVMAVAAMFVRDPAVRMGIDFTGGLEMQVRFAEAGSVSEAQIREVLGEFDMQASDVVQLGDPGEGAYLLRLNRESAGDQNELVDQLRETFVAKIGELEVERVGFVGPKVGEELRRDGILSLTVASLLLLIYIGFRFTPIFAPGAIVAQVHDVVVTSALLIILGMEFDLTVLGALLAILGYSINDKIVVYDRIRENLELHTAHDFPHMVNDSLNQTLSRTILTGGTAIFASFALYFWGGPVIATFGFAMGAGIIVGTYSSLYITTPILLALQARYGKQAAVPGGKAAGKAAGKKGGKRGAGGERRAGHVA
jgi:preprotein translocase subunit SecF